MRRRIDNPPNPWHGTTVDLLGPAPDVELEVWEEEARSILSRNDSPDLPFRWSLNPYRGCFHACAYCYARPTHEYLDWGAGTDFDRRIVVKINAPALLRAHLKRRSWRREVIAFSGATDCYQPLEAHYGLTRRCLEVCEELGNPVAVVTKGALCERDADLLARLRAHVSISLPFADESAARAIEPYAATPARRLDALRRLSEAGVETGVAIAPVMPGLNDHDIPAILERARAAGAKRASMTLVRLTGSVLPVFEARLREAFPERANRVLSVLSEMRDGELGEGRFEHRMVGRGPRWEVIARLFEMHCRRLGIATSASAIEVADLPRIRQGELFGAE